MSRERTDLGRRAEDLALEYLQSIGYRLQARNYRFRGGELDLVMCDGPILVFVEVRSRTSQQHGTPLETIDFKKRRQIEKTAGLFLAREKINPDTPCRFDAIAVAFDNAEPHVVHVKNAFICGE